MSNLDETQVEKALDCSELLSLIADLKKEREELHQELKDIRQSLQRSGCTNIDFLRKVSHDMRTPLNRIIGFAEIMRDGMSGPVTDEQKEYLTDVYESAHELLKLINEMTASQDQIS